MTVDWFNCPMCIPATLPNDITPAAQPAKGRQWEFKGTLRIFSWHLDRGIKYDIESITVIVSLSTQKMVKIFNFVVD